MCEYYRKKVTKSILLVYATKVYLLNALKIIDTNIMKIL